MWVFTVANLENLEVLDAITHFAQCVIEFIDTCSLHDQLDPRRTDLVLDLDERAGNLKDYCGYYIRAAGTVYWFDEFKAEDLEIWKAVPGVTLTDAHIGTFPIRNIRN